MKKTLLISMTLILFILISVAFAVLRVKVIHHMISDDMSIRAELTDAAFGIRGGFFDNPQWSPDGSKIAFDFSIPTALSVIAVINGDGTGLRQLTNGDDDDPTWSPDGSRIAFGCFLNDVLEIWTMNSDGTNQVYLTNGFAPEWGSNNRIVFSNNRDLWTVNPDGSSLARLTSDPELESSPEWSPDSSQIAFTRNKDGKENIWAMNADGTNQRQLTTIDGGAPSWSPDGQWIVFSSDRQNKSDLWAVNSNVQEDVVNLPTGAKGAGKSSWSPDGKHIVFEGVYELKWNTGLYIMTLR